MDTANTPTRSGKSVDGDSAVKSTGKQKKVANATANSKIHGNCHGGFILF